MTRCTTIIDVRTEPQNSLSFNDKTQIEKFIYTLFRTDFL